MLKFLQNYFSNPPEKVIKKMLIIFILFFNLFSQTYVINIDQEKVKNLQATHEAAQKIADAAQETANDSIDVKEARRDIENSKAEVEIAKKELEKAKVGKSPYSVEEAEAELKETQKILKEDQERFNNLPENKKAEELQKIADDARDTACAASGSCIDKSTFIINVDDISPGMTVTGKTDVLNFTLGTIIQKLMIALGSLSLLIMTVGAGYMILYAGQDELLSKGKSIFISGITALVVALGSYYLVALLRYILFTVN